MATSSQHKSRGVSGQTVLIIGASAGIGKATAMRLLEEGYTVYAAARRIEKMRDLEDLGAIVLKMDVTREEDLVAGVQRINDDHGGMDILINNAGFGLYGAMEDVPIDEARYQFEVNLFGLARLTQLVLPHMRQQGAGKIVNISSIAGKIYIPLGSWYIATKHALEGWSDCLRFELKSFGVDVILVEPGLIHTEFGDVANGPMIERSGNSAYSHLVNRMTERSNGHGSPPSVIANTVLKAVKAKRSKTRYAAGQYAKPVLFLRKIVSDRMYDRVLERMVG